MNRVLKKHAGWQKRKARVRKKIKASSARPRLNVFRSNKHIYAQLIDDKSGTTIISASTVIKDLKKAAGKGKKIDAAKLVGETIGKLAASKGIKDVVFDRSGYLFHGRVKSLAEGARGAGLNF